MRHLITVADLSAAEIERIIAGAADLKCKLLAGLRPPMLPGRVLTLLFEKPSLRTRVSFEAAMAQLGGSSLFLGADAGFGHRESIADFGRVLSEYADAIVIRAKRHQTVLDVAQHSSCSVINGLTDQSHPCQALSDLFTLRELLGKPDGHTLAWVGDANNVARSLATGCGKLGIRFVMATPTQYQFSRNDLALLHRDVPELQLEVGTDPVQAVRNAAAVYTDVWTSMGQEAEREERLRAFAPYQVNAQLMSHAPKNCYVMHCLPAHRGEEVTDEVIDGPQSVVVQQAANRMHLQKGILTWLLGGE
jgi:ornithine carbamoyltransferase